MSRSRDLHLQFVSKFIDSVTIRPFMADLQRMKSQPEIFRALPRLDDRTAAAESVHAA